MRPSASRRPATHLVFAGIVLAAPALHAAEERKITTQEIEAWLESPAGAPGTSDSGADLDQPPPPPPRHHGVVIESSVGFLGHLGPMKHISPTTPWLRLKLGFEPLSWLLLFGETDLAFANTSYAHPPPPSRTYALYGFGGGARVTLAPWERLGFFLQGSLGAAEVSEDVLQIYGFDHADELNTYAGVELGVDWYQVNPHLAVALAGGLRTYAAFDRERDAASPFVLLGSLAIRYTF